MKKVIDILNKNKDEIISLYNNGMLQKEIADLYCVSKSSIGRLLRSNGIVSNPRLTDETKSQIITLYNEGLTHKNIANICNVSENSVYKVLSDFNVEKRDISHVRQKYSLNEHYFDVIDTPNKAYILGFLYADGYNNYTNRTVTLSLQERDKEILEKINNEIGSNRPLFFENIKDKRPTCQNQYRLSITNKHVSETLKNLGVTKAKSLELTFPVWLDEKLIPHFLRGYMDGDGYIAKRPNDYHTSFVSTYSFCLSAKEIIDNTLGVSCNIVLDGRTNDITSTLNINKKYQSKMFLDWIYQDADLYLDRKYQLYKNKKYE